MRGLGGVAFSGRILYIASLDVRRGFFMGAVCAPPLGSVWKYWCTLSGVLNEGSAVEPFRFGGPLRGRFRKSFKCRWLVLSQEEGVVGVCRGEFALSGVK